MVRTITADNCELTQGRKDWLLSAGNRGNTGTTHKGELACPFKLTDGLMPAVSWKAQPHKLRKVRRL